ncbi:MAG TPA: hypothetical protein VN512_07510 [Clostridia bacterium]|nr:hypothetical protein [Clostridia bacterium]
MDQQNNGNTGAPSTDTTSALFVSARKKQLEQQEAERQAKEREAERLAAEAEVRRLEQEVAERKRRAQEEAQRVEQEAQRAEQEAATRRQQAQQEAQQAAAQAAPPVAYAAPKQDGAHKAKFNLPLNKWVLIGGGAVLLLAVILIVALSAGGGSVNAKNFTGEVLSTDGLSVSYPETWSGYMLAGNGAGLYLEEDDGLSVLAVMDVTDGLNSAIANGADAVTAAEGFLYDVAGLFASGSAVTDMAPQLTKSGSSVQGSAGFRYQNGGTDMQGVVKIESLQGARTIISAYAVPEGKTADKQTKVCEAILGTLMIGDPGDSAAYSEGYVNSDPAEATPYWETDSRFMLYYNDETGIRCYISPELDGNDNVFAQNDIQLKGVSFLDKFILVDFTDAYWSALAEDDSFEDLAKAFIRLMMDASLEDAYNISLGTPVAEATGTRMDFSFDMESGSAICALRVFDAEGICLVVMGHEISPEQQEYFDVMAASMSVAVG